MSESVHLHEVVVPLSLGQGPHSSPSSERRVKDGTVGETDQSVFVVDQLLSNEDVYNTCLSAPDSSRHNLTTRSEPSASFRHFLFPFNSFLCPRCYDDPLPNVARSLPLNAPSHSLHPVIYPKKHRAILHTVPFYIPFTSHTSNLRFPRLSQSILYHPFSSWFHIPLFRSNW